MYSLIIMTKRKKMQEIKDERFPNPLVYADYKKDKDGNDRKILLNDFFWKDPIFSDIRIPCGFIWDGASIPSQAWSILNLHPFSSEVVRAGLVHDWLYRRHIVNREDADLMFRRIMKYEGELGSIKIQVMFWAVRMFGETAYLTEIQESEYLRPDETKEFTN